MNTNLSEVVLLIALLAGAYWWGDHNSNNACVAGQARGFEAQADAERAALKRLQDAQALGDTLSDNLSKTEATLAKKKKELSDVISKITTGRVCLDGRVVRLLNGASLDSEGGMPKAARAFIAAGGAAAADTDLSGGQAATDTDIAGWAGNARIQYETCRARLDALIDFDETVHTQGKQ